MLMQNDSFIRVMHRIFSWLFFGSIALLVLSLVLLPIAFTRQEMRTANRSEQVRYDTLLTNQGTSVFNALAVDNTGQLISKIERQNEYLTYYGENGESIAHLRLDSMDNIASTLRMVRKKHARQIDSVLVANPYAMVYQFPDRWLIGADAFSGYAFNATLPYYGLFESGADSRLLWPVIDWQRTVSYVPAATVRLSQDRNTPYQLTVNIRRWSDLTPAAWPVMVITLIMFLLVAGFFILIIYWFRAIFADLLRGHYFERQIVKRVRYIGWLFVVGFVVKNGVDVMKPLLAKYYLQSQGYEDGGWGWTWNGPDYWLWLWAGLVLLVFARIFSYGTQLQREHDLTI